MTNEQLLDYIKKSVEAGSTKEQISAALLRQGWQQQDIDEAFSAASTPVPAPPAQNEQPEFGQAGPLIGIGKLFGQTWEMYKKHLGVFLGIVFLPILTAAIFVIALGIMAVYAAGAAASGSWGQILPVLLLLAAIILVFALAQAWSQVALISVLANDQERPGVFGAYRRGWHFVLSYWWIALLTGFIVAGGLFLLVVPGIIFILWFIFAPFILVAENVRGMNALLKSREYVRGRWGGVFLRFLCVFTPYAVAVIVINAVLGSSTVASQIGNLILALFLAPFLTTYLFLLYTNLRESKGNFVFNPTRGQKAKFILVGFADILIILALGILLIARINSARNNASLPGATGSNSSFSKEKDLRRVSDISTIQTALMAYASDHSGVYPSSLNDLVPKYLEVIPNDPNGALYSYCSINTVTRDYALEAVLENAGSNPMHESSDLMPCAPSLATKCQAYSPTANVYCVASNPIKTPSTPDNRDFYRAMNLGDARFTLDTYFNLHGHLPTAAKANACENFSAHLDAALGTLGTQFSDPLPGRDYMYAVDVNNPQNYVVMATLENPENTSKFSDRYTSQGMVLGCNCTGSALCEQP